MVRRQRSHCSSASTATSPKPSSALLPTMKAQDWQFEPQDASAAEAERALAVELTHKQVVSRPTRGQSRAWTHSWTPKPRQPSHRALPITAQSDSSSDMDRPILASDCTRWREFTIRPCAQLVGPSYQTCRRCRSRRPSLWTTYRSSSEACEAFPAASGRPRAPLEDCESLRLRRKLAATRSVPAQQLLPHTLP
jgi:hypothetical protein